MGKFRLSPLCTAQFDSGFHKGLKVMKREKFQNNIRFFKCRASQNMLAQEAHTRPK